MLHLVSGINSLCLYARLILVPVPVFLNHLFLHPSLLPLLIHHSAHPKLFFTPSLQPTCFTNPTPVISLLLSGLHGLLAGPFLLSYLIFFSIFFSFLCRALDQAGHSVSFWAHVNLPYCIVVYLHYGTRHFPLGLAWLLQTGCPNRDRAMRVCSRGRGQPLSDCWWACVKAVQLKRWLYWRHWPTLTVVHCWVLRQSQPTSPTTSYSTSMQNFSWLHRKLSPVANSYLHISLLSISLPGFFCGAIYELYKNFCAKYTFCVTRFSWLLLNCLFGSRKSVCLVLQIHKSHMFNFRKSILTWSNWTS